MTKTTKKSIGDEYKAPISPKEPKTPPPPAGGPGSPMEIIFSFDTTGSMSSLLDEVRKNVSELIKRLQDDIPNIRIGVIAHGDYCDERSSYVVKMIDFTRETQKLVDFVNGVEQTGGGDADECYELALKTARTQFTWTPGTLRSIVVIGDADPHEPSYHFYKNHTKIDWKEECKNLVNMGVHIYGVNCSSTTEKKFYQDLAKLTDGTYLALSDFKNIFDLICAICYREHGVEYFMAYEKEVREREKRISKDLDNMLVTLRKSASNASTMSLKGSDPPTPRTTTLKRMAPAPDDAPTPKKKIKFDLGAKKRPALKRTKTPPSLKKKLSVLKEARKIVRKSKAGKKAVSRMTTRAMTKSMKIGGGKRILREQKPAGALVKGSSWSKWELLFSPEPSGKATRLRIGRVGYVNTRVFAQDKNQPALYEVAVCTATSKRKYPVYVRRTVNSRATLATHLFRYAAGVRLQIDDLLTKNCRIYVRRNLLTTTSCGTPVQKLRRTSSGLTALKNQFDYAWCKNGYGRRRQRSVTKNGVLISNAYY